MILISWPPHPFDHSVCKIVSIFSIPRGEEDDSHSSKRFAYENTLGGNSFSVKEGACYLKTVVLSPKNRIIFTCPLFK
jgi:hypothetical protein